MKPKLIFLQIQTIIWTEIGFKVDNRRYCSESQNCETRNLFVRKFSQPLHLPPMFTNLNEYTNTNARHNFLKCIQMQIWQLLRIYTNTNLKIIKYIDQIYLKHNTSCNLSSNVHKYTKQIYYNTQIQIWQFENIEMHETSPPENTTYRNLSTKASVLTFSQQFEMYTCKIVHVYIVHWILYIETYLLTNR